MVYSIEGLADFTKDVIKSLGSKKTILIGHSMGGLISMELNNSLNNDSITTE